MSDQKKQYVTALGTIQAFTKDGVKQPAVTYDSHNNQDLARFTIRTGTQVLIGITLFPELAHVADKLQEGFGVIVDGAYSENEKNGRAYRSITAKNLVVVPCVQRIEREVVNAQPAQAAAPAPAQGSPFGGTSF